MACPATSSPTTSIPVAILVFDRSREKGGENENRRDVMFIDASRDFQSGKSNNTLMEAHINKILTTYSERHDVERYAHTAPVEELKENDFNLNIPRYVDTFEEEEEIDIATVQQEIEQIELELMDVRAQMDEYLREVMV